jgi:hypothetical protein
VKWSSFDRVSTGVVWHGTVEEANEFAAAIGHNCSCQFGPAGNRVETCSAHALTEDQRTLDRLVFARYMAARLVEQEFCWPLPDAHG